MSLAFDRQRKMRLATIWLAAFSIGIAGLAYLTITFMENSAEQRRLDQVKLSSVNAQIYRLQGVLDAGVLGAATSRFELVRSGIEQSLRELESSGHREDLRELRLAYTTYIRAADRELQAIRQDRRHESARLNLEVTRPAYGRMISAAGRLYDRLNRDAGRWSGFAAITIAWSLLLAAVLLSLVLALYQRRLASFYALESTQHAVRADERLFRALVRNSADVICVTSPDGAFQLVSDASSRVFKRSPETLVGENLEGILHPEDRETFMPLFEQVARRERMEAELDTRVLDGSGGYRDQQVKLTNLLKDLDVAGVLLTFHDVTEQTKLERELTYHAFHDRLTGLPNRALFMDRLAHRIRASERQLDQIAIMFIDLDNFKVINDSLGHDAGDALLVRVAERLKAMLRPSDTVARLGGDEFTLLLDGSQTQEQAAEVAQRILAALESPISLGDREVFVSASIGIAFAFGPRSDVQSLLRDADTAMYRAKNSGKSSYAVFDRTMNERAVERLELETDLRQAIDLGQLSLKYQPIVDIASGSLNEVEVLLRWDHPTRGFVPPTSFIPIAEETGLICTIGGWVLRQGCRQLLKWTEGFDHFRDLGLSVNVSARQLYQDDFVHQIGSVLDEFRLDPSRLKLEITESAMLNDLARIRRVFEQIRTLGVRIAIDDFGTGYSSMAYLSHLPVDSLKIDRSFVSTLGSDGRIDGVVRAMITMARTLGIDVTSEGIETSQQLGVLRNLGCHSGQGYLFAHPIDADEISVMLASPRLSPVFRLAA